MEKIDLLLVKPGNQKKLYGELSTSLSAIEPPFWGGLLAAFNRQNGYSVAIIDAEADNLDPNETVSKIIEYNPLLAAVMVSGTNPSASTPCMPGARSILTALKAGDPQIKTIMVGLHPSALPERTMSEEPTDFVCEGEGFYTITPLLSTLKSRKNDYRIKGLWYRENGKIVSNPRAPLIKDLDTLPFLAWDLLPMDKYRAHNWHCFDRIDERQPYAVISTSLGCPFQCTFCCINALFGRPGIRYRSPENVVDEIGYLVKNFKVRNIKILDELFVLKEDHVNRICDLIIERGYDLNIWAYARIDTINEKLVRKMKQAGINWLAFGIEAGSEKVRHGVVKGRFNNDRVRQVVRMVMDAGVHVNGNYIFGLPDDTSDTMQETLDFAKELNCEYANFYATMAYPGSKLYEEAVRNGVRLPDTWLGYAQLSEETLPLPTRYLSSAEVLRFRDRAFIEYSSSSQYLGMVKRTFGQKAVEHVKSMLERKIHRKYT